MLLFLAQGISVDQSSKPPVYFELTIETRREGADHHIGRMIVKADTREEAIQGLQDVLSGKISMRDVPKTGLDLRKNPPTSGTLTFRSGNNNPHLGVSGALVIHSSTCTIMNNGVCLCGASERQRRLNEGESND